MSDKRAHEFGGENEAGEEEGETFPVENGEETMSVSSSSKRIKEMPIDRLSALPDCLLTHILSFLEMKEAAITAVLSKRWQFLWTGLFWMIFHESSMDDEKICKFVAWVNRTLAICSGNGLEGFIVEFWYDEYFASNVDVWVAFAVKNKVKVVTLLLNNWEDDDDDDDDVDDDLYVLPQLMYSHSSMTELSLRGCIIAPQGTIEWRSLTKLALDKMGLDQHVLEKISSGCPILRGLYLRECWGFNCLEVRSQSLRELGVEDCQCRRNERMLEISAPFIRSLDIGQDPEDRRLRLTNIPFVVKACICFTGAEWDPSEEEVIRNTKECEYLRNVYELELGCGFMQVLSMLVVNGWQLPRSRRGWLIVNACREEQSISGIVGLLESSPNLEKLDIEGYDPDGASKTWSPPARDDLNCDLLNLKIVNITNLADPKFGGEPMLTLAQILLKRATVLEKMVIDVGKTTFSSRDASSDFTNMAQTLLSYPRSSKNAQVILR